MGFLKLNKLIPDEYCISALYLHWWVLAKICSFRFLKNLFDVFFNVGEKNEQFSEIILWFIGKIYAKTKQFIHAQML